MKASKPCTPITHSLSLTGRLHAHTHVHAHAHTHTHTLPTHYHPQLGHTLLTRKLSAVVQLNYYNCYDCLGIYQRIFRVFKLANNLQIMCLDRFVYTKTTFAKCVISKCVVNCGCNSELSIHSLLGILQDS